MAFAIPDVKVFVNVKSGMASITVPILPMIQSLVVQPVGINQEFLSLIVCDFAIIIGMIFK